MVQRRDQEKETGMESEMESIPDSKEKEKGRVQRVLSGKERGRMSKQRDDFYNNIPDGRCKGCTYARSVVATGQWMFLGCYHTPYTGKRVAEIKNCPKERSGEQNERDM